MSVELHGPMDRLNLMDASSPGTNSPVQSSPSASSMGAAGHPRFNGAGHGLHPPSSAMRKQRSQRFTVPTSPPQPTDSCLQDHNVPFHPSSPPGLARKGYYVEMNRSASHQSNGFSPESYGAAPFNLNLSHVRGDEGDFPPSQQRAHHQYSMPSSQSHQSLYSKSGYGAPGQPRENGSRAQYPNDWIQPQVSTAAPAHLSAASQYARNDLAPLAPNGYAALMGRSASEDEVIPTAIVIKNIPFQVPKEHLLGVMEDLRLPPPFAFNYHYDQGQFRGLAFANFRHAADAALTVSALNGFDLQGRKLRTEFKKVLKEGEKERIERDKAIKRMRSTQQLHSIATGSGMDMMGPPAGWNRRQASAPGAYAAADEEDYGRPIYGQYSTYGTTGDAAYGATRDADVPAPGRTFGQREYVPAPGFLPATADSSSAGLNTRDGYPTSPPSDVGTSISARMAKEYSGSSSESSGSGLGKSDLDLNDPRSLEIYSRVLLFKDDALRDELAFARSLAPSQRRTVHLVAQKLGLDHRSVGQGDQRHVVVIKPGQGAPSIALNGPQQHKSLRHSASTLSHRPSRDVLNSYLSPAAYGPPAHLRTRKSLSDFRYATGTAGPEHFGANSVGSGYGHQQYQQQQQRSQPPAHHYTQPGPTNRRSHLNLREGFSSVSGASGFGMRTESARPSVQGVFTSFLNPPVASPTSSAAGVVTAHARTATSQSQAPYYSSDASSSSPSVGLSRLDRAESSQTSEDSLGAVQGQSASPSGHGQGFAVRQPRGPTGMSPATAGSWRATEQTVPE